MADNIKRVDEAAGLPVATEEVSRDAINVHLQIMKLALGADGDGIDTFLDSGQQTSANSAPVVLASDQSTIPTSISGTVTVTDDGSFTLAANSGTDIGDVTVNNAAGASAVNIQDGGNSITIDDGGSSITVDGTVSVSEPVSVDDNGGSLTVDNAALSVTGGGNESSALRVTIANDSTGVLSVDDNGSSLTIDQATASNLNAQVVGNVAHDAADSGNPIKIGGKAHDMVPADAEQGPSDVAENDRADLLVDQKGRVMTGVNCRYNVLTAINTDYDTTSTETNTSTEIECFQYRQATLYVEITKTGSPTDILFEVEVSMDGTNFAPMVNNALGSFLFSNAAIGSGIEQAYTFPIACQEIRVKATATGLSAGVDEITVANASLYLRD